MVLNVCSFFFPIIFREKQFYISRKASQGGFIYVVISFLLKYDHSFIHITLKTVMFTVMLSKVRNSLLLHLLW